MGTTGVKIQLDLECSAQEWSQVRLDASAQEGLHPEIAFLDVVQSTTQGHAVWWQEETHEAPAYPTACLRLPVYPRAISTVD